MNTTRREFLAAAAAMPVLAPLLHANPPASENPFLSGAFAPVDKEVSVDSLRVLGTIPKDLNGMFVRNGPNPQFPPRNRYHWFDGDGMLHGVRLQDGKASYRNRWVRTEKFQKERTAGKSLYPGLIDPVKITEMSPPANRANTALVHHAGKLLALFEAGLPYEVRLADLETVGPYSFGGKLRTPFTAHPKIDPETGAMLYFGYGPIKPYVHFGEVDAKGQWLRAVPVDIPRSIMMHDFAVTRNYAIFMDLPATFDIPRAMKGGPIVDFEPVHGARFGLLPRRGGPIKWFHSSPCFVFHTLNAYDVGDSVVLLACRYDRLPEIFPADGKYRLDRPDYACLYRWRFDLKTGRTSEERLDDRSTEFPRVPESLTGRSTRYGYAGHVENLHFEGLVKYDLEKKSSVYHRFGANRGGGEGVFVPRPGAKVEDDGWLMTFLHDRDKNQSELLIVDAATMDRTPVARVFLPQRVPYGFHGLWVEANT